MCNIFCVMCHIFCLRKSSWTFNLKSLLNVLIWLKSFRTTSQNFTQPGFPPQVGGVGWGWGGHPHRALHSYCLSTALPEWCWLLDSPWLENQILKFMPSLEKVKVWPDFYKANPFLLATCRFDSHLSFLALRVLTLSVLTPQKLHMAS